METNKFIDGIIEETKMGILKVQALKTMPVETLQWKTTPAAWNTLECIEHLNRYGSYYNSEIEQALHNTTTTRTLNFKSGVLGNYFSKMMLPKAKLNTMKTFKDKNPINSGVKVGVLDEFIAQQIQFIALLEKAKNVGINAIKISSSFSKMVKLRLGDTFQFMLNHNKRHFVQIENIAQVRPKVQKIAV